MIISVYKARPVGEQQIPDMAIRAFAPFPENAEMARAAQQHQTDAELVGIALYASLPGGTLDRLFAWMVQKQASLLQIRYPETSAQPDTPSTREP